MKRLYAAPILCGARRDLALESDAVSMHMAYIHSALDLSLNRINRLVLQMPEAKKEHRRRQVSFIGHYKISLHRWFCSQLAFIDTFILLSR